YARAMSAYGLLLALSGFTFNKGNGSIGFAPRIGGKRFQTFWALDGVWGTFEQTARQAVLSVEYGEILLNRIDLPEFAPPGPVKAMLGKRAVKAEADEYGSITLVKPLTVEAGQKLSLARQRIGS
ncbi:MAG: non-lysosomal glucosylceramidase, partial [Candidatus Hydrogenedentes bacterium]|nr:non-lysosomal glucosylceramidase [Candidatus Hydrogenedentota bacterium]